MHSEIDIIYTVFTGSKIKTEYPNITISAGKYWILICWWNFGAKKIFHYTPEPNEIAQVQSDKSQRGLHVHHDCISRFHKSVIRPHPYNFLFVWHPVEKGTSGQTIK